MFSFPAAAGKRDHGRGPAVNLREQEADGYHTRHRKGQGLHHIGPDYRFDPAPGDVENADDRKKQDGRDNGPAD